MATAPAGAVHDDRLAAVPHRRRLLRWTGNPVLPRANGAPLDRVALDGPFDFPMDAAGALDVLDASWRGWRAGLEAGGEEALWRPLGDAEGDLGFMQLGATDPFIGLVLHVHREVIHHGAEILLLRDLYRAVDGSPSMRGVPPVQD